MIRHAGLALLFTAGLQVQNAPAPAAIANKLDTPPARSYVAENTGDHAIRILEVDSKGLSAATAKADDVRMSGPAIHTEQNASDQPADRIAIELK
jgi:hypothetical protein